MVIVCLSVIRDTVLFKFQSCTALQRKEGLQLAAGDPAAATTCTYDMCDTPDLRKKGQPVAKRNAGACWVQAAAWVAGAVCVIRASVELPPFRRCFFFRVCRLLFALPCTRGTMAAYNSRSTIRPN